MEVISENGAFGDGLFCDESFSLANDTLFHNYTCWDLTARGKQVASARNAVQLFDVQWDPSTARVVGLGICCDGVEGCPPECKGHAGNRTWVTWDPRGGGAPAIKARLDALFTPVDRMLTDFKVQGGVIGSARVAEGGAAAAAAAAAPR